MLYNLYMRRRQEKRRKSLRNTVIIIPLIALFLLASLTLPQVYQEITKSNKAYNPTSVISTSSTDDIQVKLHEKNIQFSEMKYLPDESGVYFKVNDTTEVYLSSQKDIEYQISSLQILLSQLTIDSKQAKRIDFRYVRPIVKL